MTGGSADPRGPAGPFDPPDAITALSATELSARIESGSLSCAEVMAAHLDRIGAVNPALNAIVSLRPRAELMAEAREADGTARRGWLHGMPFAVKDLVATRGIRTTWGSPIFADHVPVEDDLLARRLRSAGAILIGKTNTPEFGLGSHSYNPVHGVTRNPFDLTRGAGGSSGGAGAALAAHLVPVADGSDMMGSLRNPAAFCGIWGFRPTCGLIPSDRADDPLVAELATNGPMGRNVEDLARLLDVLAGPATPFADTLDADPRGRRIGWLADWDGAWPVEEGILDVCATALAAFEARGCAVEPLSAPFPAEDLWSAWITLRARSVANRLGPHLDDAERRALLKPEAVWEIERGRALSDADLRNARSVRAAWLARLDGLFDRFDALALPCAQVWPFPAEWRWPRTIAGTAMDTYHRWMEAVVPVSLAGLPCLGVPAGSGAAGLHTGLQIFGRAGADRDILALGASVDPARAR